MAGKDTRFKPGQSGNPKGRVKGVRNKITKKVLDSMLKAYDPEVIERIKETHPDVYMRLYAQLIPKDVDVKHSGDVSVRVVNYEDED